MTESCAARSTVLNALNLLEQAGLITRVAQYHESGARRSSRYFLNHPQAPHMQVGRDPDSPGPPAGRGVSRCETGGVHDLDPPGVRQPDALNPSLEPPSEPADLLRLMPTPWRLSRREIAKLSPAVERAFAAGWTAPSLMAHLSRSSEGIRHPAAVLAQRLAQLPQPPTISRQRRKPWCGECGDDRARTINITLPDGTDEVQFCPRCSPQLNPPRTRPNVSHAQQLKE